MVSQRGNKVSLPGESGGGDDSRSPGSKWKYRHYFLRLSDPAKSVAPAVQNWSFMLLANMILLSLALASPPAAAADTVSAPRPKPLAPASAPRGKPTPSLAPRGGNNPKPRPTGEPQLKRRKPPV